MNITDIRIFPVDDKKLRAFVSVIFDSCFLVSDIKIIDGAKGLFLSMPSKKRRDGTFKDVAHPLNVDTRKMMEDAIFAKFHEEAAKGRPAISGDAAEAAAAASGPPETVEAVEVSAEPPAEA